VFGGTGIRCSILPDSRPHLRRNGPHAEGELAKREDIRLGAQLRSAHLLSQEISGGQGNLRKETVSQVERLIAGEKMEIGLLLDWLVQFSGSNRNLGDNYDAVERRGTKHPNFAFADKIRLRHQESDSIQEKTNKENIGIPSLGKSYDPKTIQKLAQFDSMKSERDFYYSKLRDIDQVLDTYKESNVQTLIQTIRDIIYVTPEMVSIVTEDGHVVIKGEHENKYDDTFNQNMNFANANNSELSEFNFDSNINLLNENMDLESFK
jgi:hypothetical protein